MTVLYSPSGRANTGMARSSNYLNERDAFLKYSNENGVITRPAWELMNRLPLFKNAQCGDLSNSELIAARLINLPGSALKQNV